MQLPATGRRGSGQRLRAAGRSWVLRKSSVEHRAGVGRLEVCDFGR